jgi:hypothetical protein
MSENARKGNQRVSARKEFKSLPQKPTMRTLSSSPLFAVAGISVLMAQIGVPAQTQNTTSRTVLWYRTLHRSGTMLFLWAKAVSAHWSSAAQIQSATTETCNPLHRWRKDRLVLAELRASFHHAHEATDAVLPSLH